MPNSFESERADVAQDFIPESNDALENEFFDLLWRCGDAKLERRDRAEEELTANFDRFESVWMTPSFLYDGQVGAEARLRFERAAARRRVALVRRALDEFVATWQIAPFDESSDLKLARATVALPSNARVLYYQPNFSRLFWHNERSGETWRPRARFLDSEIAPETRERTLTFESPLELCDPLDLPLDALGIALDRPSAAPFSALVGLDARPLPVKLELPSDDDRAPIQVYDLKLQARVRPFEASDNSGAGERGDLWRVVVTLDYARAYDVFDSHRAPIRPEDFQARVGDELRLDPCRVRQLERSQNGVALELTFERARDFQPALESNRAILQCRVPKFWAIISDLIPRSNRENPDSDVE